MPGVKPRRRFRRSRCAVAAVPMVIIDQKMALPLLALLAAMATGCADGPIPETKYLNPWVRKQWNEDEQRVTTYHRKVADLAALRSKAPHMPAAELEETSAHLAARLQEEKSAALRCEFVRTLTAFPTPVAQQALVASTADESASVRALACKGLGRNPSPEGFQALTQAVTADNDLDVRIAAAHELGKFRGFEAPQALRPAL